MSSFYNPRLSAATDFLEQLGEISFEHETGMGHITCKGSPGARATEIRMAQVSTSNHTGDGLDQRSHLGFRLSVVTQTHLSVWLFFVPERFARKAWVRWLYRIKRWSVIGIPDPALAEFRAVAEDTRWTSRFMLDVKAMDAVQALLTEKRRPGPEPSLHLDPERLHYGSPILNADDLDTTWVQQLIERLHLIADRVEQLPPPANPAHFNRLQLFGRKHPVMLGLILVVGILAGLAVITVVLAAFAIWMF